jgi:VWFA-related protein
MPARYAAVGAVLLALFAPPLSFSATMLRGTVKMADGSALREPAVVVLTCYYTMTGTRKETEIITRVKTGKRGDYMLNWQGLHDCSVVARLGEDVSRKLDLRSYEARIGYESIFWLPVITLGKDVLSTRVVSALESGNWPQAEAGAREALRDNPDFAAALSALAISLDNQGKRTEARGAYERLVSRNPGLTAANRALLRLQTNDGDWSAAALTAARLLEGPDREQAAPHLDLAAILCHLDDPDGAEAELKRALEIDPSAARERAGAISAAISEIRNTRGAARVATRPREASPQRLSGSELEEIPGGIRALAAILHMEGGWTPSDFLAAYCRTVVERGTSPESAALMAADLRAYFAAVADLDAPEGFVELNLEKNRREAERTLALFGWKLRTKEGRTKVEPDIRPEAGPRQQIPAALGIDEPAMVKALETSGVFSFRVERTRLRVVRAAEWRALGGEQTPGGIAALLGGNPAYAKTYAGLASVGPGATDALLAGSNLRTLAEKYADALFANGAALALEQGRAAVPGGAAAEPIWLELAGADPVDSKAFFPALLEKDRGSLAAFYGALAQGDQAHRRFFTATPSRAARFYAWLRSKDSGPWRKDLFRALPLDAAGNVRYPGSKAAWTDFNGPEDETLLQLPSLEPLLAAARIEERRGAPLDAGAARLFAAHFDSWRTLIPYFEALPGLGRNELEALEAFERAASNRPSQELNGILGQWHALVKLAVLATRAGSLDAPAAARAFRRACGLATAGNASGEGDAGLAALREMTGGAADLDEAVPSRLLRLAGDRRAAFDRVLSLQKVPTLAAASDHPDLRPAALAGLAYAAALDPGTLLVSEDSAFLRRHRFAPEQRSGRIFFPSKLQIDSLHGSYLSGGFAGLEETAAALGRAPLQTAEGMAARGGAGVVPGSASPDSELVFRAGATLVEVYATVTDRRGNVVDGLERGNFTILDNGRETPMGVFEDQVTGVSVALMLDSTGSMQPALPALRSAALNLIDGLRPGDSLAVFSFNDTASALLDFTTDKDAARRAVLHTYARGDTALYDALAYVKRSISGRTGKKAIVMFTDGEDTTSALASVAAIEGVRTAGIPIYSIAHGLASNSPALQTELAAISRATGGAAYAVTNDSRLSETFAAVSRDLTHGYLLTFKPTAPVGAWHELKVELKDPQGRIVRARQGYYRD